MPNPLCHFYPVHRGHPIIQQYRAIGLAAGRGPIDFVQRSLAAVRSVTRTPWRVRASRRIIRLTSVSSTIRVSYARRSTRAAQARVFTARPAP